MFFDDDCVEAFEILKKALISAPIVQLPDWNLPFEIMCDASDYAVGVVLLVACVGIIPEEEGKMQHSRDKYFPQL